MIYNPGVLKRFYRSGSVFVLVLVFGQFFSCYSPEMQHYRKAQSLEMQGNSFEAEKEYLKALEEAPDDAVVVFAFAQYYTRQEKHKEALEYYTRFLEMTENEKWKWEDERWEAQFYADKAAQEEGD